MKKLILLFLFSINANALTTSELLILKKKNYQVMKSHYSDLKADLENGNGEKFCKKAASIVPDLYTINDNDRDLFFSLKEYENPDFDDYATHLNENSRSDIFNFSYFESKCNNDDALAVLSSFGRTEMNLQFLIMTHNLWIESFCPKLSGSCSEY